MDDNPRTIFDVLWAVWHEAQVCLVTPRLLEMMERAIVALEEGANVHDLMDREESKNE